MRVNGGESANGPVPHTPVFFVKADSKGVASAFAVKAVDKGLTGAFFVSLLLSWKKEEWAGTAHFPQIVRNGIAGKELACLGGAGMVPCRANLGPVNS